MDPDLIIAAKTGNDAEVSALLLAGADVNEVDTEGKTALMIAALNGNTALVSLLLKAGADLNHAYRPWRYSFGGKTALILAVEKGHAAVVSLLLKAGAEVDKTDDGITALMAASGQGHNAVVSLLLKAGAEVNKEYPTEKGLTALAFAVYHGNADVVSALLAAGADVNKARAYGKTELIIAAQKGYAAVVSLLLKAGADVNKADEDGKTALIIAIIKGRADLLSLLLKAGADVNKADEHGKTALMLAAQSGYDAVVSLFLKAGADVNKADEDGKTALMLALNYPVISALLGAGADVNKTRADGKTALIVAAGNGYADLVSLFLKAGADVNTVAANGTTALISAACGRGPAAVVEALLAAGAEVDTAGENGLTALMRSSFVGKDAVVSLLLKAGADVNKANARGETALILAAQEGRAAVVSLLLKAGADVNTSIGDGTTALMLASRRGHAAVVSLLLEAGVDVKKANNAGNTAMMTASQWGKAAVVSLLRAWLFVKPVCDAASSPAAREAAGVPQTLVDALTEAKRGLSASQLSEIRGPSGLTMLGCVAAAGANKQVLKALMEAGCSVVVPGDLAGASVGDLAARAGQDSTADWLYRAATKKVANIYPTFKYVWNTLMVGTSGSRAGRPFMSLDVLNYIMDFCATPDSCWFAEIPRVIIMDSEDLYAGGKRYRGQAVTIRNIKKLSGGMKEILMQRHSDGKLKIILVGGVKRGRDDDDDQPSKRVKHNDVTLVSLDAEEFIIPRRVADMSLMVAGIFKRVEKGEEEKVPVQVKGAVLKKVLEWCTYHTDNGYMERIGKPLKSFEVSPWDAEFVNNNIEMLFELIEAANYLDIKSLLDLTCAKVASLIKNKTLDEIFKVFKIDPVFTREEDNEFKNEFNTLLTGGHDWSRIHQSLRKDPRRLQRHGLIK